MDGERFFFTQRVARLATVTADGAPRIVPVVYVYDGKRVAPMWLKRVRNIAANPRVALIVDHYSEDWRTMACH